MLEHTSRWCKLGKAGMCSDSFDSLRPRCRSGSSRGSCRSVLEMQPRLGDSRSTVSANGWRRRAWLAKSIASSSGPPRNGDCCARLRSSGCDQGVPMKREDVLNCEVADIVTSHQPVVQWSEKKSSLSYRARMNCGMLDRNTRWLRYGFTRCDGRPVRHEPHISLSRCCPPKLQKQSLHLGRDRGIDQAMGHYGPAGPQQAETGILGRSLLLRSSVQGSSGCQCVKRACHPIHRRHRVTVSWGGSEHQGSQARLAASEDPQPGVTGSGRSVAGVAGSGAALAGGSSRGCKRKPDMAGTQLAGAKGAHPGRTQQGSTTSYPREL